VNQEINGNKEPVLTGEEKVVEIQVIALKLPMVSGSNESLEYHTALFKLGTT
jgi:hypothetical protein